MSTTVSEPIITWDKLPDGFLLPDEPVNNFNQPLLATALTESLELAGHNELLRPANAEVGVSNLSVSK